MLDRGRERIGREVVIDHDQGAGPARYTWDIKFLFDVTLEHDDYGTWHGSMAQGGLKKKSSKFVIPSKSRKSGNSSSKSLAPRKGEHLVQ